MKNVLMVFLFSAGIAIAGADAQSCTPCPPECKTAPCQAVCKESAASVPAPMIGVASFASFAPEAMTTQCMPGTMTKNEEKSCQAKCSPSASSKCTVAPACSATVGLAVNAPALLSPEPKKQ